MIKFIVVFVCVAKLAAVVESAESIYKPEDKPEDFKNVQGCYLSKFGFVLPVLEEYSPINGECKQYVCQENDGETKEFSCGVYAANDNCQLTDGDLSKPYPDCCTATVCVSKDPPTIQGSEPQPEANDSGANASDGADAVACASADA